jgi:predicted component of type VI protein secretion system
MKVEKRHALIKRMDGRYILVNHGAPPQHTLVNGSPVPHGRELQDGDRIQLGNVLLRFQLRAAVNRARAPRLPPGAFVPVKVQRH